MKRLLFLVVLIVATHAIDKAFIQQMKQKLKENVESCAKQEGASADEVLILLQQKVPNTHAGQCVYFCIHKTYNAQNEDGSLNMEGALKNLEILKDVDIDIFEKATTVFKNCESTPTDNDPCVYASMLVECIVKESQALGLTDAIAD